MANAKPQNKEAQIKAELKETKVRTFGDPQQANRSSKPKKGQGQGRKPGDRNNSRPKAGGQGKTKAKNVQDRRNPGPNKSGWPGGPNSKRKRKGGANEFTVDKGKQTYEQTKGQQVREQVDKAKVAPPKSKQAPEGQVDKGRLAVEPMTQQVQTDPLPVVRENVARDAVQLEQKAEQTFEQQSAQKFEQEPASEAVSKKDRRSKSWLEMTAEELRQANEDLEEEILQGISEIAQIRLN